MAYYSVVSKIWMFFFSIFLLFIWDKVSLCKISPVRDPGSVASLFDLLIDWLIDLQSWIAPQIPYAHPLGKLCPKVPSAVITTTLKKIVLLD